MSTILCDFLFEYIINLYYFSFLLNTSNPTFFFHKRTYLHTVNESTRLATSEKSYVRLSNVLKPFFLRYDSDGNEVLDRLELAAVFNDLGEKKQFHLFYVVLLLFFFI